MNQPPADEELIQSLNGLNTLWEYQLTLSTFILTFFTSQAYQYWRNVYFTTRAIQGRINDVCLLISLGAERGVCDMDSCDVDAMALRLLPERAVAQLRADDDRGAEGIGMDHRPGLAGRDADLGHVLAVDLVSIEVDYSSIVELELQAQGGAGRVAIEGEIMAEVICG